MKKFAIIVAGGSGSRMGGGIPKQFRTLCSRPVLWWSMKAFHEENPDTRLILVLPREFINLWDEIFSSLPANDRFPHEVAVGGNSRTESVKNGLMLAVDSDSLVAVHDAARPLVTAAIISKGWATAEEYGAAIPVVAVTDSLRTVESFPSRAVNRDEFVAVQTPQVFKTHILKKAYEEAGDEVFSDDATAVEQSGEAVTLFQGTHYNMKVTNPKDMAIAEAIMADV